MSSEGRAWFVQLACLPGAVRSLIMGAVGQGSTGLSCCSSAVMPLNVGGPWVWLPAGAEQIWISLEPQFPLSVKGWVKGGLCVPSPPLALVHFGCCVLAPSSCLLGVPWYSRCWKIRVLRAPTAGLDHSCPISSVCQSLTSAPAIAPHCVCPAQWF